MRELTDATFEHEVLQAERPVVVDFWAPWCRPCRALEPILEKLESRVTVTRLNIDEHPAIDKEQAACIERTSCAQLRAQGVCDRAHEYRLRDGNSSPVPPPSPQICGPR